MQEGPTRLVGVGSRRPPSTTNTIILPSCPTLASILHGRHPLTIATTAFHAAFHRPSRTRHMPIPPDAIRTFRWALTGCCDRSGQI